MYAIWKRPVASEPVGGKVGTAHLINEAVKKEVGYVHPAWMLSDAMPAMPNRRSMP